MGLNSGRVDDPDELPLVVVDQAAAAADLQARGTEQRARLARLAGREEDRVAGARADGGDQARALGLGEVLGDRSAELAVLADRDVREALGAALLGPLLPGVEPAARRRAAARLHDGADVRRLEHAERGVDEVLGQLDELEAEPQVGLVVAVAGHRLGERHARDRRRDGRPR